MKAVKWLLILGGSLVVLVIAALLIIPAFVDINKYKPEIEKQVAKATGRSFSIGSDLDLSLFPFAGVSFSDLKLGNLPGFTQKEFVSVDAFEVRIKLLPLLSKDIQLKRFILKGPRIVLEKNKNGKANWEFAQARQKKEEPKPTEESSPGISGELPIKNLTVGEFMISDGSLLYADHGSGLKKEISDLNLQLQDVSLDKPIKMVFSTLLDKKPIKLEGKVGPVGPSPGKGTIPFDLVLNALNHLKATFNGNIQTPTEKPAFDLKIKVSEFSPRKLMKELGQEFPIATTDPDAINRISLEAGLKGSTMAISLSDGILALDDSTLKFSASAKDFDKPDINVNLELDKIDADRYLPPKTDTQPTADKEKPAKASEKQKTDYTPLRKMILEAALKIGDLKVNNLKIQDLLVKITAKNGVFNLNTLSMNLYDGKIKGNGTLNVQASSPNTKMDLAVNSVNIAPLMKDMAGKDLIEGTTEAKISIRMTGDDPEAIKKTLNGNGEIVFLDGAIVGIDIAGMVRNAKSALGLAEKVDVDSRPRTDFTEFKVPFTITNGNVKTPGSSLKSPLIRLLAAGNADLVKETLDFRIEPKLVASLEGQGDNKDRSGLMVPVMVSGTFSEPKFRPDLESIAKSLLKGKVLESEEVKKLLDKKEIKPFEDQAKSLLNKFLKK
ncbi:MAG TPA: AsmA family protein [Deltaproteobacteria bacterium]|nr:AsmA family protein [Deltaproteobacteria bacterium]